MLGTSHSGVEGEKSDRMDWFLNAGLQKSVRAEELSLELLLKRQTSTTYTWISDSGGLGVVSLSLQIQDSFIAVSF